MTEKTKSWIKDNFLLLVVTALISGFWVSYEVDKSQHDTLDRSQGVDIQELKVITYNLARGHEWTISEVDKLNEKFQTVDERFMEVYKLLPRGAKVQ